MGRKMSVPALMLLATTLLAGCDGADDGAQPASDGGGMADVALDGAAAAAPDAAEGAEGDAGCPDGPGCDAEPDAAGCGPGPACMAPDVCREGRCVPPDACAGDGDCPNGGVCSDGRCLQSGCQSDDDCPGALVCDDRRCVDPPACGPDDPCPGDAVCEDGACVDPGCADDDECPAGAVCRDAMCVPGCADDGGCPAEQICVEAMCAPPMCMADGDCAPADVCDDRRCVPAPGPAACVDPRPMPDFGVYRGTTIGAPSAVVANCGDATGPEVALRFQLDRDADVCLSTMGSDYDSVIYVRTDCADRASEVVCRDDGFGRDPFQAQVRVMAQAGVEYFVFIDGFRGATGDYVLEFVDGPCPEMPPPPECAVDEDCGMSERCEGGACVPAP